MRVESVLDIQVDHARTVVLKLRDIKERLRRAVVARGVALPHSLEWQAVEWPTFSPAKLRLASVLVSQSRLVGDIDLLLDLIHVDLQ